MKYLDLLMMKNVPPFPTIRKDSMQQIMAIDRKTETAINNLTKAVNELTKELKAIKNKKDWNHHLTMDYTEGPDLEENGVRQLAKDNC